MATLLYDLDADALGTTGTSVASWTDSVASRVFAQATSTLQPTVVAGPNGHKAAKFDGKALVSAAAATAQPALSIVMVMRLDAVPATARAGLISGTSATSTNDYAVATGGWALTNPYDPTETAFSSVLVGGAPTGTDSRLKTTTNALGEWVVVTVVIGSDGVAQKLYTNGTVDSVSTGGVDNPDLSLANLAIGSRYYAATSDYSKFSLARARVFSGRLTDAERAAEHTAISTKYAITVSDFIGTSAVPVDAITSGVVAAGNSVTLSHTIGSTANLLVVAVSTNTFSATTDQAGTASITCGGVALTRVPNTQAKSTGGALGTNRATEFWYLQNPGAGTKSIVTTMVAPAGAATTTVNMDVTAISLIGAASTPFGTPAIFGTSTSSTGMSVTTTSPADSLVLSSAVARSTTAISPSALLTQLAAPITGNVASLLSRRAGGTSVVSAVSWTTADQGAMVAVPILAASSYVDTTAPTITSFTATPSNVSGSVGLTWTTSDDVAVTGVTLLRNGAQVYTGTSPSFTDTGLVDGVTYTWTLTARDAAGNTKSATVSGASVTPALPGRQHHRWNGTSLVLQKTDRWSGTAIVARISEIYGALSSSPAAAGFPTSLGTLTARPSWATSAAAAGPVDQPAVSTRTRTLELPNLPVIGGDISAAWVAYWGNQTGSNGTRQAGDRVTIPAGNWTHAGNLDVPPGASDIELVLGSSTAACVITATDATAGNNAPPQIGLRVIGSSSSPTTAAKNITVRGASSSFPAVLRTRGMAGRGDKNQQGHARLEVEYCTGFRAQDLILRDSKAAGFFAYRADNYWLNRVRVERSKADAFHATNGSSYGVYSDCSSDGAGDDMLAFVHYDRTDAPISVSHHMEVYRYKGERNGHGRGLAVIACHDIYADQVVIEGSAAASVIIDREAKTYGSYAEQGIYNVLLQRFALIGGNWSEQDHGSVFIGNGNTAATVDTVRLESFHIHDTRVNQTAVRGVGSGTMNVVLQDFEFTGGLPSTGNRDKVGGNWVAPSTMTISNWVTKTTGPTDSTAPTVVINCPGELATVSGILTGSSGSSTHLMTNTQAIQFYAGDSPADVTAYAVLVDGSTGAGLSTPTALDTAGRGSCDWDTTAVANGQHTITVKATDAVGLITTKSITVTVAN